MDQTPSTHNLSLEELDKERLLHPATSIADHLANGPRIMSEGKGVHVTDSKGNTFIDGAAGLWCVNVGYGRQEIVDAVNKQISTLPFFHSFTSMSNEASILLGDKVLSHTPKGMSKIIFGSGGSDANDTNIKLVWYYNNLRGKPEKKKIISRDRAYHGVTIGSGSLTGLPLYHEKFDLPLPQMRYASSVDMYRGKPDDMSEADFAKKLASEIEDMIIAEGPETVGAFIAEPVMGTGGVLPPPAGYFKEVQKVLDKYDVLMIADEVICGFGRLGRWFGSDLYEIRPDIMTMAKGLSSGYLPLSASAISERIWDVLRDTSSQMASFGHGFTYSAHPVCAAAALANIEIMERENLIEKAATTGAYMMKRLKEELGDSPIVGDIRGEGMIFGVEFVKNRDTKEAFELGLKTAGKVQAQGYENGLLVRTLPHRDVIAMSPPLTMTEENVETLVSALKTSVATVTDLHKTAGEI
ncbi:aminotransferase [Celeribacter litoreus]|uniref:aminotransferase n=1 Tax=Celeribacter litoreus TaxID=2876714 RepID=UPI001CC9CA9D|nr:aminotransferase [Celeribacter litoreus]MCA0042507.1 aminotransferase class III-fold pyridoxal phosphate-dependent enzyme [Celeribacter litoreus]